MSQSEDGEGSVICLSSDEEKDGEDWSEVDDDDFEEVGVNRRRLQQRQPGPGKKSKRRRLSSASSSTDHEEEEEYTNNLWAVRKSTRKVTYKEVDSDDEDDNDDDDFLEDQENYANEQEEVDESTEDYIEEPEENRMLRVAKVMNQRQGKIGATGPITTTYAIQENGDPNAISMESNSKRLEKQFLIKWTGLSHLHNTYESFDSLAARGVEGVAIVRNFLKKADAFAAWKTYADPEDVEFYSCQLEMDQDLAKSYLNAERVVAKRMSTRGEIMYFVKWEGLQYSEATWELGSLIYARNSNAIDRFNKREASSTTPGPTLKAFRSRPTFEKILEQPEYTMGDNRNLLLRDYQLDGLNWLVHTWCTDRSVILADEMGLGKTIQAITFLAYLMETWELYGPFLLIVPLSTMAGWQKEFSQWAPQINVVTYLGDIKSREIIKQMEWFRDTDTPQLKFNAILTTYETVVKDAAVLGSLRWAMMIVDEAQRLKNSDSLFYRTVKEFKSIHRLLMTGTPLQNDLKELWALLHFIMPNKFDDWEEFECEHDNAVSQGKGYAKLHKELQPFMLRRVKKDVEKSLPAKVEQILRVGMTSAQKQYYKWIVTKNIIALRKGASRSVSSLCNIVMELRKCCNHATLVRSTGVVDDLKELINGSGKLVLLDKLLVRLQQTGHRVLIFSQMVRMLDIIADYLQLRRFAYQRLDGSITGDRRKQALDHFNAVDSTDFCFLLSTRAGGLGINLATADTVIIFDSDWNPQNDLQAQARAHRIGQKKQVQVYRLVTKGSVEEDIVQRAKSKMVLDHLVIQRMECGVQSKKTNVPFTGTELAAIIKFGAENLFKDDDNAEDKCDIDEILQRAETRAAEDNERPEDELLSAFKVASFAVPEEKDWEDIIPAGYMQKVRAEEEEKDNMAVVCLPPRRVQKYKTNYSDYVNNDNDHQDADFRMADAEPESDDSEEGGGHKPKKREKTSVLGFTDAQVRAFINKFKSVSQPMLRMDAIGKDAMLVGKSRIELEGLAKLLLQNLIKCQKHRMGNVNNGAENGNKNLRPGFFFELGGVTVDANKLAARLDQMELLDKLMPANLEARQYWKLDFRTKLAPFDVEWSEAEDSRLLIGIWEHGLGSWEAIRAADPLLKDKIFTEGSYKPRATDLGHRFEYVLRHVKKRSLAIQKYIQRKQNQEKKPKKAKVADVGFVQNSVNVNAIVDSVAQFGPSPSTSNSTKFAKRSYDSCYKVKVTPIFPNVEPTPVSFVAVKNKPPMVSADVTLLDSTVVKECRKRMCAVQHALKNFGAHDTKLTKRQEQQKRKEHVLQIGDQIQTCLRVQELVDASQCHEWKKNLWTFAASFTQHDDKKLYMQYRLYQRDRLKDEEKNLTNNTNTN